MTTSAVTCGSVRAVVHSVRRIGVVVERSTFVHVGLERNKFLALEPLVGWDVVIFCTGGQRCRSCTGLPLVSSLMTVTASQTYCGFSDEPVPWSALETIFAALFGADRQGLQKFPQVVGGTWARWTDSSDLEHDASHLNDVKNAYGQELTKQIHFSNLSLEFGYTPGTRPPVACLRIEGDPDDVERKIEAVRRVFPRQRRTIFVSWSKPKGLAIAEQLAAVLRTRAPSGTEIFVSDAGISPGSEPFKVMLDDHLRVANAHVVVVTAEGYSSPWVTWEAATSWARRVPVVPIFVDIFPHDLAGHPLVTLAQGAPLREQVKLNAAVEALLRAVGKHVTEPLSDEECRTLGVTI